MHTHQIKYGIENFKFGILEYYPGIVKKGNLNKDHTKLLHMEGKYLELYNPDYNMTLDNSGKFKSDDIIKKVYLQKFTDERVEQVRNINLGKKFNKEKRDLLSKIATLRNKNEKLREKLSFKSSKPLILYNLDGTVKKEFKGICEFSKYYNCCTKTINKIIKNEKNFRDYGKIKLENLGLNPITLQKFNGTLEKYKDITSMAKKYKCAHRTINNSINNNTIFKKLGYVKLDRVYKNEE